MRVENFAVAASYAVYTRVATSYKERVHNGDVQMTAKKPQTDSEKLVARVQKLLNMSKSGNANEAASALAKANEIMQAEGISLLDVSRSQIGESKVKSTQSVSKPKDWENALVCAVGRAFACHVLWQPGASYMRDYWGRYIFVGHKDYVVLAEFAAVSMLRQLVKAKNKRNKELNDEGCPKRMLSAQLNGFCWGWVNVVGDKVAAFAKETSPEFAKMVKEFCAEQTQGRESKSRKNSVDYDAMADGMAAAHSVEIHRPMTGAEAQKQIGGK